MGWGINTLLPLEKNADHQERVELEPMKVSWADISAMTSSADEVWEYFALFIHIMSFSIERA